MGAGDRIPGQNRTSAPPSNDLSDAYIKLREYLVHKPADFLVESAAKSSNRSTWDLAGKALLGNDGAFYTADIFSRKIDETLQIKEEDLTIYWSGTSDEASAKRPFAPFSLKTAISYQSVVEENNAKTQNVAKIQQARDAYDKKIDNLEREVTQFYLASSISGSFKIVSGTFNVNALSDTSGKQISPPIVFSFRFAGGLSDVPQIGDIDKALTQAQSVIKRSDFKAPDSKKIPAFNAAVSSLKTEIQAAITDLTPLATNLKTSIAGSPAFNLDTSVPTTSRPAVSIYEYTGDKVAIDTATTDYCDAFFNLIDNINLSLAVPFVRINIIDRVSRSRKTEPKMSLVSFLRSPGDSNFDDLIFANARPKLLPADDSISKRIMSGKFVGIETFLGPNTLLPDPTDEILNPRRLNPSVPLMSLLSFSTSIESQGAAMLSRKKGELSIVVHDRSRLNDVSSMVSLGDFSALYFDIEWGYIHPHGDPSFNNPVGQYLNAMRFREIYSPNTYTMTMGEGGSMTINIGMLAAGYLDATNTSVVTGDYVSRSLATRMLNSYVFNLLVQDFASSASDSVQADVRPITEVLARQDTVGRYVRREFINKIMSRPQRDDVNLDDEKKFISELKDILKKSDEEPYRQTDFLKDLTTNLKIASVGRFGQDTFQKMKDKYGNQVAPGEYASVASILTQCAGIPFAMSGLYSEVQIHVFRYSDSAGALANQPITRACLSINDFVGKPDEQGSLYNTDGVITALARLCKNLSNPDALCYGIASLPSPKVEKTSTTTASPPTAGPTAAASTAANAAANGPAKASSPTPTFIVPNVKWDMRTIPAKVMPATSINPADAKSDPELPILQILIYDDNRLAVGSDIVKAYNYLSKVRGKNLTGATSEKDDNSLTIDDVKLISKIAYPNMTYGAVNSVIKALSISTNTRSAIATSATIQAGQEALNDQIKSVSPSEIRQIQLIPGSITLTIFGLPVIERGQSIYLDLGTGTTLDQLYKVTAVRHNLTGDFTTDLTLQFVGQGTLINTENAIDDFLKTIEQRAETVASTPVPAEPATTAPTKPARPADALDAQRSFEDVSL